MGSGRDGRPELLLGDTVFGEEGVQPVHPWQRDMVLPDRYGDLLRDGAIEILDDELEAVPTAALRTLWVPSLGEYFKVSLDIQVTSTRRSISIASTRNGPAVSRLLPPPADHRPQRPPDTKVSSSSTT